MPELGAHRTRDVGQLGHARGRADTERARLAGSDLGYIETWRKFVYDPVFTGAAALKESIRNFETEIGPRLTAAFPPQPGKK